MQAEQDQWIFFEKINFSAPDVNFISIDTRDFHGKVMDMPADCGFKPSQYENLKDEFFFTPDEVLKTLQDIFTKSGGAIKWRYLSLKGRGVQVSNGWLKYFRIQKTPKGFIILNRDSVRAISKSIFAESLIDNELLNAH